MSVSTHSGFSEPPSWLASVVSDGAPFVAYSSRPSPGHPLFCDPYGVAVGVGHILTASRSVMPSCDVQSSVLAVARRAPLASVVTGVGHRRTAARSPVSPFAYPSVRVFGPLVASLAMGVGHDKEPLAAVRRPDVGGSDDASVDAVAAAHEVGDNTIHPSRNERADVLDDDERRPDFVDDSRVLAPESGARAIEAEPSAHDADVLAREATADDVHGSEV